MYGEINHAVELNHYTWVRPNDNCVIKSRYINLYSDHDLTYATSNNRYKSEYK